MRELEPTVLGTLKPDDAPPSVQDTSGSPIHVDESPALVKRTMDQSQQNVTPTYSYKVLTAILWITVCAMQVSVYFDSRDDCKLYFLKYSEDISRLERLAWLIPNYVLAPWVALALVSLFLHHRGRYMHDMFHHRWTWRYSLCNLVASIFSSLPVLKRNCGGEETNCYRRWVCDFMNIVASTFAYTLGDACWITFYLIANVILFALMYNKLRTLEQKKAACWFRRILFFMLGAWAGIFLPTFVVPYFAVSNSRVVIVVIFIAAFMVNTIIVFLAMRYAAAIAEVVANKTTSKDVGDKLRRAVRWTRFTAHATVGSMGSSILMQVGLLIWMWQGFRDNYMRVVVDWIAAFDTCMNVMCAATLSGMIGPEGSLELVEGAFEQVGTALLEHDAS